MPRVPPHGGPCHSSGQCNTSGNSKAFMVQPLCTAASKLDTCSDQQTSNIDLYVHKRISQPFTLCCGQHILPQGSFHRLMPRDLGMSTGQPNGYGSCPASRSISWHRHTEGNAGRNCHLLAMLCSLSRREDQMHSQHKTPDDAMACECFC